MNKFLLSTRKKLSPTQIILLSFTMLIIIGSFLLLLPISNKNGPDSLINTVFVVTSALCVTGLTPIIIHEQYTLFGQSVLLTLIEIGGIGFMSIPILFYYIRKKKINFSTRLLLRESMNLELKSSEVFLALNIIKISFIIQIIGAIALSFTFIPKYGLSKGIWFSIFHAVSSFCNAGFDLFGNSLVDFKNIPEVLLIISALIISGGLGFVVWMDILQKRRKRMTLHSKISLVTTILLLVIGTFYFFFDHSNEGSFFNKFSQSLFLATTPRTAGFYSINYQKMTYTGLMVTMILMFIGGTPGSTAGGLKTTTIAILFVKIKSLLKNRTHAEIFGRTINDLYILKAFTIFFLAILLTISSILLLSITEAYSDISLLGLSFEVISALGTVGLTVGVTDKLSIIGKMIIILLMFIGRIGIMTFVLSVMKKENKNEIRIKYPEENVMLG